MVKKIDTEGETHQRVMTFVDLEGLAETHVDPLTSLTGGGKTIGALSWLLDEEIWL